MSHKTAATQMLVCGCSHTQKYEVFVIFMFKLRGSIKIIGLGGMLLANNLKCFAKKKRYDFPSYFINSKNKATLFFF